jgi:hypothetical protein
MAFHIIIIVNSACGNIRLKARAHTALPLEEGNLCASFFYYNQPDAMFDSPLSVSRCC